MSEQQEHLDRVSARIGAAIREFCRTLEGMEFHADDLRRFVRGRCGEVAPGSADRVLRDLRKKGLVSYVVISRRDSLYRVLPSVMDYKQTQLEIE